MPAVDPGNPWTFGAVVTAIWVAIWVVLAAVLFDGGPLGAAVQGGVGGIAFSLVYLYIRRNEGA